MDGLIIDTGSNESYLGSDRIPGHATKQTQREPNNTQTNPNPSEIKEETL